WTSCSPWLPFLGAKNQTEPDLKTLLMERILSSYSKGHGMWSETCMKSLQVDQELPPQGEASSPSVWDLPLIDPPGQRLSKGYSAASHGNCKTRVHTCTRHCGLCGNTRSPGAAGNKET
ncbi:hypothetical protein L208DRAFT_1315111, partial [Tricholoma matsutake]